MRRPNPVVELASGEFDRRKASIKQPGVAIVARHYGISPQQLLNYRANYISRNKRKENK
jgi:hypothetical protein